MIYQCRTCNRQSRVKPFTACECGSLGFWEIEDAFHTRVARIMRQPQIYEGLGVERLDLGTKKQETIKTMNETNEKQAETPRTDAMFSAYNLRHKGAEDPADFTRRLERELSAANATIAEMKKQSDG